MGELRRFALFFGSKHSLFPESDDEAAVFVWQCMSTQPFFVAERDGKLLGLIAGVLAPHPYNPKIFVLSEQFWWVAPEHSGSSAGARLFDAFLTYGRQYADWIVMTLETKSPINPRSLERKGFRNFEQSYLLEVS